MSSNRPARSDAAIRAAARGAVVAVLVLVAYVVVLLPWSGGHAELAPSVLATALVVATSSYLRPRIDHAVDRFVHGERAGAIEDLQRFASSFGEALDPMAVPERVVETAQRLVAAQHAELRLQLPGGRVLHTTRPVGSTAEAFALVVPVRHDGEPIGVLSVAKQPGDPLSPTDEQLINRLAQAASVALDNARLAIELREQLDEIASVVGELQRSSARIVAASENEQRRIERAIRERVEQPLRQALSRSRKAYAVVETRPQVASEAVDLASTDVTEALTSLRDVAHGIFPSLLATEGLARAIAGRARREGWRVDISGDGFDDSRLEPEARSTAYFALIELARTAGPASTVSIELSADDRFAVAKVVGLGAVDDPDLERALERVHILGGTVTELEGSLSIALPLALPIAATS